MAFALVNSTTASGPGTDPNGSMTITIPSTVAGNLICVIFYNGHVGSSIPLTSITGSSETWEDPNKAIWNLASELIDFFYTRDAVGGDTSYTLNYASSNGGVQWATVLEFSYDHTGGDCVLDDIQSAYSTSSAANPVGQPLTIAGANDVIVQVQCGNNNITAVNLSYVFNRPRFGFADAYKLNTTDGTAPTWTMAAGGQNTIGLGAAFTEAAGGAGTDTTYVPRLLNRSLARDRARATVLQRWRMQPPVAPPVTMSVIVDTDVPLLRQRHRPQAWRLPSLRPASQIADAAVSVIVDTDVPLLRQWHRPQVWRPPAWPSWAQSASVVTGPSPYVPPPPINLTTQFPTGAYLLAPVPPAPVIAAESGSFGSQQWRLTQPWFAWFDKVRELVSGLASGVRHGVGAPEGVVFAPPGTIWLRGDGVAPVLWVKESAATSNTGWRAL